jgi:hypothetical protein
LRLFKQDTGFESIETAQLYLSVFMKPYRFTPFSDDAKLRTRGKCPLERWLTKMFHSGDAPNKSIERERQMCYTGRNKQPGG